VDELFPQQPNGITYFKQSFTEPFVDEYKNSFDLVHLRGSMAGAAPKQPIDVVRNLATVLKPGGWVQLQEFNSWNPPSNGPALTDFAKMTTEAWKGIGVGDFANSMKSMLEEAGLKNVQERRVICQIGKMAKPELAAKGVSGIYGPVAPIASVASTVPSSFTKEELQALPGRVKEELENEGGQAEIIIVWGQRA
jgi:SAM-dependent methyltransferase